MVRWLEESQAAGAGRLAGQSKLAAGSAGYIINIESVFLSCFKTFNNILFQIVNFKMIVLEVMLRMNLLMLFLIRQSKLLKTTSLPAPELTVM